MVGHGVRGVDLDPGHRSALPFQYHVGSVTLDHPLDGHVIPPLAPRDYARALTILEASAIAYTRLLDQ